MRFFAFCLLLCLFPPALIAQADDYTDHPFWRQALGGAVIGRPVAQQESVVLITDGGNLGSYSRQGRALWNYYARGRLLPFVSRSREGTSYICRTNGILIAVNRSGRELWQQNLGAPLIYPVMIGWDGRLFIFTEGKITCMTAAGFVLWSRTLENRTVLTPVMDIRGGLILVQEDGEVLSIDPFGGTVSYRYVGGISGSVPVAAASLDIEGRGPSILLLHGDRHMELVYENSAYGETLRGILDLPAAPLAAAGPRGGAERDQAAVLLRDGRVALLSLGSREILWTAQSHVSAGEFSGRAGGMGEELDFFYDERGVYVLSRSGATAFDFEGRRLWIVRLRGAAAAPSFGDDGILYSGGSDWILYAYRLEEQVMARQRLLYGEAAEGTYGMGDPGPSSWANFHFRFSETELELRFSEIRRAISAGAVGSLETEYAAWLMETAGSLSAPPRNLVRPPVHTQHRMEAARLLAYIGSRETIPFLANLFRRDPEPIVKAAAAEAFGRIGVDPEGLALRAFESAVFPFTQVDETVLTAIAAAVGALCRFSGPPLSHAGIRLLTILSADNKPPRTRRQAQIEIRSL